VVQAAKEQGQQVHVFFMYTDKTISTFAIIKEAMRLCLERLERKIREEHAGAV
jgi:hypothetical protein